MKQKRKRTIGNKYKYIPKFETSSFPESESSDELDRIMSMEEASTPAPNVHYPPQHNTSRITRFPQLTKDLDCLTRKGGIQVQPERPSQVNQNLK